MFDEFVSSNESTIRATVFIVLFAIFALSEWLRPRRPLTARKTTRWFTNWTIVVLDSVFVRLIFPKVHHKLSRLSNQKSIGNNLRIKFIQNWLTIFFVGQ